MQGNFCSDTETDKDNIAMGNSSSLNQMFDTMMRAMVFGEVDSDKPWSAIEGRKWLCPAPGYDRHFRVTQTLGFELIAVPMTDDGPDMNMVEELVKDERLWVSGVFRATVTLTASFILKRPASVLPG